MEMYRLCGHGGFAARAKRAGGLQPLDAFGRQAQFREDLLGVRAEQGRDAADLLRRAPQLDGETEHLDLAFDGMLSLHDHVAGPGLFAVQRFLVILYGGGGHAGGQQQVHPFGGGAAGELLFQQRDQRLPVL